MDDAVVSLALCNYFKPLAEAVEIYIVLYGFELEDSDLLRSCEKIGTSTFCTLDSGYLECMPL